MPGNLPPWKDIVESAPMIRLRAKVVLACLSLSAALPPCILVDYLSNALGHHNSQVDFQAICISIGAVIYFLSKHAARIAFEAAIDEQTIAFSKSDRYEIVIEEHCSNAWLVQLHLELTALTVDTHVPYHDDRA